MHPSTHNPGRDAGSGWSEPKAKRPAKRRKKSATKKSATKKSAAKKSTATKSTAKKTPVKKSRAAAAGGPLFHASPQEVIRQLHDPDFAAAVLRQIAGDQRAARQPVAALRREVTALKRLVADLSDKLSRLSAGFADLAARSPFDLPPDEEIVENPFARWLQDPSIEQYRGEHIALHEARGVIAHASEPAEVIAEVRAQGVPLEDIVLHFISERPF